MEHGGDRWIARNGFVRAHQRVHGPTVRRTSAVPHLHPVRVDLDLDGNIVPVVRMHEEIQYSFPDGRVGIRILLGPVDALEANRSDHVFREQESHDLVRHVEQRPFHQILEQDVRTLELPDLHIRALREHLRLGVEKQGSAHLRMAVDHQFELLEDLIDGHVLLTLGEHPLVAGHPYEIQIDRVVQVVQRQVRWFLGPGCHPSFERTGPEVVALQFPSSASGLAVDLPVEEQKLGALLDLHSQIDHPGHFVVRDHGDYPQGGFDLVREHLQKAPVVLDTHYVPDIIHTYVEGTAVGVGECRDIAQILVRPGLLELVMEVLDDIDLAFFGELVSFRTLSVLTAALVTGRSHTFTIACMQCDYNKLLQ